MAGMFIAQHHFGRPVGQVLAIGWVVLLAIMLPLTRDVWLAPAPRQELSAEGANAIQ